MKYKMSFSLIEIIIAILMFLMLRPSFTWSWDMTMIHYCLLLLIASQFDFRQKNNAALLLFFILIVSIVPITHGSNLFGIITSVLLAVIPFAKKDVTLRSFDIFKYIVAGVMSISILVWFSVVVFQVSLPYTVIPPLNELKDANYMSYPFLVMYMSIKDIAIVRFSGVYDEPGVIGTLGLLFIYYGDFKMKRFENIVFLIGGIISFSLFFYLGFVIMLLLKVFLNKELKKYRIPSLVAIVALAVAILTIPVVNEMIGSRLEYDEEKGTITGNDRSNNELDNYIESIRGTSLYYWGDPKHETDYDESASLQNAVLRYGVVFMVLFFIFYFLYAKSRLHNHWVEIGLFMLILFLSLYQRPGFLIPTYLFIFSSIVQSHQVRIEEKRKQLAYERTIKPVYQQPVQQS